MSKQIISYTNSLASTCKLLLFFGKVSVTIIISGLSNSAITVISSHLLSKMSAFMSVTVKPEGVSFMLPLFNEIPVSSDKLIFV